MDDLLGTATFKHESTAKGGDDIFALDRTSTEEWGETKKGRDPNSYVPIGDFRHTLRRNIYASGMGNVESFDVEYRIVNIKTRKASKASASTGAPALDGAAMRDLFIEIGDVKGLTALFVNAGLKPAQAKASATLAIENAS